MRRPVSHGLGVALLVALAGCATTPREAGLPLPPEPVRVTAAEGQAIPVARSYSEILVRTYVEDGPGRRRELGGADCRLVVGDYEARFRSPGRVLVPVPERGGPVLGVGCRAGELEGTARRGVVRERVADHPYWGPYHGGWYGPWWGDPYYRRRSGAWLAGAPYWYDPYWGPRWRRDRVAGYPDVEVILR